MYLCFLVSRVGSSLPPLGNGEHYNTDGVSLGLREGRCQDEIGGQEMYGVRGALKSKWGRSRRRRRREGRKMSWEESHLWCRMRKSGEAQSRDWPSQWTCTGQEQLGSKMPFLLLAHWLQAAGGESSLRVNVMRQWTPKCGRWALSASFIPSSTFSLEAGVLNISPPWEHSICLSVGVPTGK